MIIIIFFKSRAQKQLVWCQEVERDSDSVLEVQICLLIVCVEKQANTARYPSQKALTALGLSVLCLVLHCSSN